MTTTPPENSDQPFGAGGYPQHPGTPEGEANRPVVAVAQPPSIRTAVRLMWAGAAVSIISLLVTLVTQDSLRTQIEEQFAKSDPNASQSTIDAAVSFGIIGGVIGGLLGALLWLLMAWKNGQGRSWARIVATVLGVINVLSTLFTLTAGNATAPALVLTFVNLALAIVILVLLWRKESSEFYAASSR